MLVFFAGFGFGWVGCWEWLGVMSVEVKKEKKEKRTSSDIGAGQEAPSMLSQLRGRWRSAARSRSATRRARRRQPRLL